MVGEDPAPRPVRHLPGGEGEDEVVVAGEDADILRGNDVSHAPILCLILCYGSPNTLHTQPLLKVALTQGEVHGVAEGLHQSSSIFINNSLHQGVIILGDPLTLGIRVSLLLAHIGLARIVLTSYI